MRVVFMALSVSLWLSLSGWLRAGLYDPKEPVAEPGTAKGAVKPLPYRQFRDIVAELRRAGVELPDNQVRTQYLERRNKLMAQPPDRLTVDERISLSACLIRLRQEEKAVEILTPVATREQPNFMVFANLALAHQLAG